MLFWSQQTNETTPKKKSTNCNYVNNTARIWAHAPFCGKIYLTCFKMTPFIFFNGNFSLSITHLSLRQKNAHTLCLGYFRANSWKTFILNTRQKTFTKVENYNHYCFKCSQFCMPLGWNVLDPFIFWQMIPCDKLYSACIFPVFLYSGNIKSRMFFFYWGLMQINWCHVLFYLFWWLSECN